jgi:hypothetical protein
MLNEPEPAGRYTAGQVFNIVIALCSTGVLAAGLASGQDVLIALGGIAVGGWAARFRWGPRS